jgi:DNA mismatch endonuclease (patch repair protein)
MKAVRQRDTEPEMKVRRLLYSLGARFRLCPRDLPGRPDIANKKKKWCVFVHGCFWHGHEGCVLSRLPRTNTSFWTQKIAANTARDERKETAMIKLGFRICIVWQCELSDETRIVRGLSKLVDAGANTHRPAF